MNFKTGDRVELTGNLFDETVEEWNYMPGDKGTVIEKIDSDNNFDTRVRMDRDNKSREMGDEELKLISETRTPKQMLVELLKDNIGIPVAYRNGNETFIIESESCGQPFTVEDETGLDEYDDNLCYKNNNNYDIVNIYAPIAVTDPVWTADNIIMMKIADIENQQRKLADQLAELQKTC